MTKENEKVNSPQADERMPTALPPGVKLLRTLEGHEDRVTSLVFNPQGDTLASGSFDGTVKLWETASGKLQRTLEGHQDRVISLAFDPQGDTLASSGFNV